jgi:sulfite exporter TauE/SafE
METIFDDCQVRSTPRGPYSLRERRAYAVFAAVAAVVVAGMWNAALVDGFGRDVVAARIVGDPDALSTTFAENGFGFGFIFAAVAGVAATFTACNCVVFALLPGLAASGQRASARRSALTTLGFFTAGVVIVGALYGMFIGSLGPTGIAAFNTREVRRGVATTVFSGIGLLMIAWGSIELGLLDGFVRRVSQATRDFFAQPTVKAGILGLMVGAFMIGRPFPVMRDFLVYAASAGSPLYGAAVMIVQGLGQIALMVMLFVAITYGTGQRLPRWASGRPEAMALVSGVSLVGGGTFFVFYWGLAFAYGIGRWGFRLGWYS